MPPKNNKYPELIALVKNAPADDSCLIWKRSNIITDPTCGNKQKHAHRLVHELFIGPLPAGYQVKQTCGNDSCMRPSHLFSRERPKMSKEEKLKKEREYYARVRRDDPEKYKEQKRRSRKPDRDNAARRRRYKLHPEKKAAMDRRYRQSHRKEHNERERKRIAANREAHNAHARELAKLRPLTEAQKERRRRRRIERTAIKKALREATPKPPKPPKKPKEKRHLRPDKIAYLAEWKKANWESHHKRRIEYARERLKIIKERGMDGWKAHCEKKKAESAKRLAEAIQTGYINRRARQRKATGRHTSADIKKIWDRQGKKCAVPNCSHPISAKGEHRFHIDHYEPLSKSLNNHPDNLMLLCPHHNREKWAKDPYEWAQTLALAQGLLFIK